MAACVCSWWHDAAGRLPPPMAACVRSWWHDAGSMRAPPPCTSRHRAAALSRHPPPDMTESHLVCVLLQHTWVFRQHWRCRPPTPDWRPAPLPGPQVQPIGPHHRPADPVASSLVMTGAGGQSALQSSARQARRTQDPVSPVRRPALSSRCETTPIRESVVCAC
jgi:hypothetical protein